MKIEATKANGTQNHFLILYSNNKNLHNKEVIQKLISKTDFKRVDGAIILSDKENLDFKMDYYNNDGTWETMCANGARCAVLYMYRKGHIKNKKMKFEAGDGLHLAEIENSNTVKLQMSIPKYCSDKIELLGVSGFHVDSGATHFVIDYPKIDNQKVKDLGSQIRYHEKFGERGINVDFYDILDSHTIYVKTYEKGIEDLMMSCGSGSVACAYHLSQISKIKSPLKVHVLGGELEIKFSDDWKNVWLSGHAEIEESIRIDF
ncbi:MAG: diaminopimelate epimerase [Candidatus Marinimicrobia bacterium]|nr:diaminopimelate epimerase [Candidatus Neomarinimicrobiota bacterium]